VYPNPLKVQTFETISSEPPNHALNGYYGDGPKHFHCLATAHARKKSRKPILEKWPQCDDKKKLRIFLMQLARVSKSAVHEPYIISNLAP